jgi:hypothetical protein
MLRFWTDAVFGDVGLVVVAAVVVAVFSGVGVAAALRFAAQYFLIRTPTASRWAADHPEDERAGLRVASVLASARAGRGAFVARFRRPRFFGAGPRKSGNAAWMALASCCSSASLACAPMRAKAFTSIGIRR